MWVFLVETRLPATTAWAVLMNATQRPRPPAPLIQRDAVSSPG
jgi:hypothetical protein